MNGVEKAVNGVTALGTTIMHIVITLQTQLDWMGKHITLQAQLDWMRKHITLQA